jgi:hypothetical protein
MSLRHGFIRTLAAGLCLAAGTAAQSTSSSTVAGLVTDPQGLAVPDAQVKLADTATGSVWSGLSNEAGRYVFVNVPPGTYHVTFSKTGFAQYEVTAQPVEVGETMTVNASLPLSTATTVIQVTASATAELQTTNGAIGTTLGGRALLDLPNLGRDAATLALYQPGVTSTGATAGATNDQNTYTVDGGNITDDIAGNLTPYQVNFTGTGGTQNNGVPSGTVPTPVESIEEFRVQVFGQTADFNNSAGSNIQMVTRRGTDKYHGALYGYYFATNLGAANSWVANHTPAAGLPYTPLPKNHRSRFGGSVGGPLLPAFAGGKTHFFFNYEGSRFPNVSSYEAVVPTPLLRAGVIQIANANGQYLPYNLNPVPVTVGGVTYNPAVCGSGLCDPRGLGLNSVVSQIWQKYMPLPNDPIYGGSDQYNTQGYLSTIHAPLTSNAYVGRLDHDFGEKNRLFATYRDMKLVNLTTSQVDIGGALPGDTFGQPAARAPHSQLPSMLVLGLTSTLTPTITNEFRAGYTRSFWQYGTSSAPPQLPGLGGALLIGSAGLVPYNVGVLGVRQRFWDGQDKLIRDDATTIRGNHLLQFGGSYQRNYDFFMRTDSGDGVDSHPIYSLTATGINFGSFAYPATVPASQQAAWNNDYSMVLGLVNLTQVTYSRSGASLALQPVGGPMYVHSIIPYYGLYANDTWHPGKSFTLTYGLAYGVEMPPYEINGEQVMLTYQDGSPVTAQAYLDQRKAAALAGQVYEPLIGFAVTPNVAGRPKYPYHPFYGGVSPRFSAAWNPVQRDGILGKLLGDGKTVIRGAYGRVYGRLNGVNQVLVPTTGPGLLQSASCNGPSMTGQCLGTGGANPASAFRIGADGGTAPLPTVAPTFPQPYIPGVSGPPAAASVLDPTYRPEQTDNFSLTVQRQISQTALLEVGYMGRLIRHQGEEVNLDTVPYMTTLGGQQFKDAWAQVYNQVANVGATGTLLAQPFFETALGGVGSSFCAGFANCTSALAAKERSFVLNGAVSDFWAAMYNAPSWTLPRSMISQNLPGLTQSQGLALTTYTSNGYGNYNALFVTLRLRDWHGITATSNFTWGRALGTAALPQANTGFTTLDDWNLAADYGVQANDIKFIYSAVLSWRSDAVFRRRGLSGRVLGGWTISPLFTAQSGAGLAFNYSQGDCTACQSFGEATPGTVVAFSDAAVAATPLHPSKSATYNMTPSSGAGSNNPTGVNLFANPAAAAASLRKCVLGFDASCGGYDGFRGLPQWNLDAALGKDIGVWRDGRVGATLNVTFTNALNHVVLGAPALAFTTPATFGRITSQANTPRNMEFGIRAHF